MGDRGLSASTRQWLDVDYWRVYEGILGLCVYSPTLKDKADFRREHEALVEKFRKRVDRG